MTARADDLLFDFLDASAALPSPFDVFSDDLCESYAAVVESDSRRERQKQAARRFRERRRNMLDTLQKEVEDLRRAVAVLRGRNEALYAMLQSTEPNCNDVWLA